jgi:hypothetical protein
VDKKAQNFNHGWTRIHTDTGIDYH